MSTVDNIVEVSLGWKIRYSEKASKDFNPYIKHVENYFHPIDYHYEDDSQAVDCLWDKLRQLLSSNGNFVQVTIKGSPRLSTINEEEYDNSS